MKREKITRIGMVRFLVACAIAVSFISPSGYAADVGVDELRFLIQAHGRQWVAGETSVSKLPDHEKKLRLGLIKRKATGKERILALEEPITGLPTSIDWRNNSGNFVTPVRNQGSCGSCWAFATTGALESNILIREGRPGQEDNRAEEILLSCSSAGSCNGGYIGSASSYIRDTGLPPESYFPYTASSGDDQCGNAQPGWEDDTANIASWSYVNTTTISIDAIKNALVTYGPLVTTMDVYGDFFNYRSGVYEYTSGSYQGGHAILLVGYTDDPFYGGGGYFVAKNSWGTSWGESGFFRIAYSQASSPVYFGEWTIAYRQAVNPTLPSAPSGLTAVAVSSSRIDLSWSDNSTNEDGFQIEACDGVGCTDFSLLSQVGPNTRSFSDTNLASSTSYTYRVRAYNAAGSSGYSNTASATTWQAPRPPSAPTNLVAVAIPKNRITLSWTDSSDNETGFKIERCSGVGCTNFAQVAKVGPNVTTYTNTALRKGTTYTYRVKAYNADGDSPYSNEASARAFR